MTFAVSRAVTQKPFQFFLDMADEFTSLMDKEDPRSDNAGCEDDSKKIVELDDSADTVQPSQTAVPKTTKADPQKGSAAAKYIQLFQLVTHLPRADEEFELRNLVLTAFFLHLLEVTLAFPQGQKEMRSDREVVIKILTYDLT